MTVRDASPETVARLGGIAASILKKLLDDPPDGADMQPPEVVSVLVAGLQLIFIHAPPEGREMILEAVTRTLTDMTENLHRRRREG